MLSSQYGCCLTGSSSGEALGDELSKTRPRWRLGETIESDRQSVTVDATLLRLWRSRWPWQQRLRWLVRLQGQAATWQDCPSGPWGRDCGMLGWVCCVCGRRLRRSRGATRVSCRLFVVCQPVSARPRNRSISGCLAVWRAHCGHETHRRCGIKLSTVH